ncbi:hypothetical protein [Citreimonas sp.]|uniref:hypothetical protein n=1 Tax=Citreimonas sp. TaxID=3036715 RepID=UPI004059951B
MAQSRPVMVGGVCTISARSARGPGPIPPAALVQARPGGHHGGRLDRYPEVPMDVFFILPVILLLGLLGWCVFQLKDDL